MTPTLLSIAIYITAFQLDNKWLAAVGCAMQVWGMVILWKQAIKWQDGRMHRHVKPKRAATHRRKPGTHRIS